MLMLSLLPLAAGVSAEPACLLQKPKAPTQLSLLAEMPVAGWEYAGKGDCSRVIGANPEPEPNPKSCALRCATDHPLAIAFSFNSDFGACYCCEGLDLEPLSPAFAYVRAVPSWQFLGVGKYCGTPAPSSPSKPLNECALVCEIDQWLLYRVTGTSATCECCATANMLDSGWHEDFVYYSKVPGWVYAGLGMCDGIFATPFAPGPNECANECSTQTATGFSYDVDLQLCDCCIGVRVETDPPTDTPYVYVLADPFWNFSAADQKCVTPFVSTSHPTLAECFKTCEPPAGTSKWLVYGYMNQNQCDCCSDDGLEAVPPDVIGGLGYQLDLEDVPGWSFGGRRMDCAGDPISTQLPLSGPNECANECSTQPATGFSYDVGSRACHCCFGVRVQTNPDPTVTPYVYVLADPFWRFFAADQTCVNPVFTSFHTTLAGCAKTCEPPDGTWKWLVYGYNNEQNRCDCCDDAGLEAVPPGGNGGLLSLGPYGGLGYQLDPLTFDDDVPGWSFGGRRMDCAGPVVAQLTLGSPSPSACATFCTPKLAGSFVIDPNFPTSTAATCKCCGILQQEGDPSSGAYGYQRLVRDDGGVGVYGDPHITALDGSHYLLLSQGTFSLWHLHGLLTEFQTQDGFKKVPVEWEIFTHYSGHQSFTKGLLLIDRSAGVQRQVLEITSQDCQWRAHSGAEWTMVSKPGMISVAEGQDYVTGFNMTKTNGRKHRGGHASRNQLNLNQVHLSMNSKDGATDIAVLTVSCRPKCNLNLNLVMKRRSDHGFVEGELAGGKKLAALETDSEFNIKGKWQDVGGSDQAAAYLRQMDEDSSSRVSLLQSCTAEDKVQAKITCSKYLDSLGHLDPAGFFLNDCVYDVCHGAGEVAAELAAELLTSASV